MKSASLKFNPLNPLTSNSHLLVQMKKETINIICEYKVGNIANFVCLWKSQMDAGKGGDNALEVGGVEEGGWVGSIR